MNDMSAVIVPKSDQLNSDDLISGPLTIRIRDVVIKPGTEQPVSIYFEGDNGKPWKSCKSMCRVLVVAWGADARKYVGRSVTLVRDPKVLWGGQAVGGIRITHLSDIDAPLTMALTATRGSRKAYTVNVLAVTQAYAASLLPTVTEYEACKTSEEFSALESRRGATWKSLNAEQKKPLKAASDAAKERLSKPAQSSRRFDKDTAIAEIKAAGDSQTLDKTWAEILGDYIQTDREVEPEVDEAYKAAQAALQS